LDELDDTFILVLEDYHVITEPAIDDFLVEILNHPPHPLRLVLSSRHDPSFALNLLRARGQMTDVRSQNLRFSLEETGSFVRQTLGSSVDAATVATLCERTEGWIAGLRLATVSLQLRGKDQTHLDEAHVRDHLVMDYLAGEVLAQQPNAIQEFLLKTSVLEHFSGPLCEAVTGQGDGQARLDWLEKNGLFVVPLDAHRQWYRFHNLFQELLQQQMARRYGRDEISALHRRAGAWFAAHDLLEEALRHDLAAGGIAEAVRLVEHHRHTLINQGQYQRLERWLRAFPRVVIDQRPALLLAEAWIAWTRYKATDVIALVDRAEALIIGQDPVSEAANGLQGEVEAYRGYQFYWKGEPARAIDHAERALRNIPCEWWNVRQITFMYLAASYQATGDLKRAFGVVDASLGEAQSNAAFQVSILTTACFLHWINADLQAVMNNANSMLALGEQHGLHHLLNLAHYFLGIVNYQRHELAQAEGHFNAVLEQRYFAHLQTLTHSAFALALTYQAQGRPDQARDTADAVPGWLAELGNLFMLSGAHAFQAELALRQRQLPAASQWAAQEQPGALIPLPWFYARPLTLTKTLLAQNTPEARQTAVAQLARLRDWAERTCNIQVLIQVLVLEAMLGDAEGDRNAALTALERAILLAQPGGFIRVFADVGPRVGELLKQLHRRNIARPYIERILSAFVPAAPVTAALNQSALIEPLTKRELEVLKLLAERLSAKEIAARLFIAPGTAKQHTNNIFEKLFANNRQEAVEKAIALGLLPQPLSP
jgi:LuxR family maltose regulon positive regulatory protein